MTQALASWLSPDLLALIVVADVSPQARAQPPIAEYDGDPSPVRARWLWVAPGAQQRDPTWLLTVMPLRSGTRSLGRLLLADDRPLTSEPVEQSLCEPAELADRCRALADPVTRGRIRAFLARAPRDHRIALEPELAASLAAISRQLRDSPAGTDRVALDTVTALDPDAFLLSGRWRQGPDATELTAVSPEGMRAPLTQAVAWLAPGGGPDGDGEGRFLAFVALDGPSIHPADWTLEVSGEDGTPLAAPGRRPVEAGTVAVEGRLLEALVGRSDEDPALGVVLAAKQRLRDLRHAPAIAHVSEQGAVPTVPEISIVVDVRQFDRVQLLLVECADEFASAAVELILVLSTAPDEQRAAAQLYALHEIPFRLVALTDPARRARAFNLGASLARGRRLLFMSEQAVGLKRGWLSELSASLGDGTLVAAVAPKLVDSDGTIVSAGHDYVAAEPPCSWQPHSPLAGASRTAPAALEPRRVTAATDACLMVDASRFHACDGFTDLYFAGGDEAGDLCLRLARAGFYTWYVPSAELLAPEAAAETTTPEVAFFNDWLFRRRWNATLALAAPTSETATQPPRRRIEALAVSPAPAASWVADARLLVADSDPALSSFDDTYAVPVHGWVRAGDGTPLAVQASVDGQPLARTDADQTDDALVARFPAAAGAGFQLVLSSLTLPTEFEVAFDAVRPDGDCCRLGSVVGRRPPLYSPYSPQLTPILVTTLGRTGSNWLLALLNAHPEIVVYRPFQYEGATLSYWIEALQALSAPASYLQAVLPELGDGRWWLGDGRQLPLPISKPGAEMVRWLGGPNVERIAAFAQSRIDDFYSELARIQRKPAARGFAEKIAPTPAARTISELYPAAREIFLVRDFRDRVCSIADYNAKRGTNLWGYTDIDDERWFAQLRAEAGNLVRHWREAREDAILVRYEDLMSEPEPTLARLLAHVGVAGSPELVRELLAAARQTLPHGQEYHRTAPSFTQSVGRWKRDLTAQQRLACARAFDDLLPEFGYEPTAAA